MALIKKFRVKSYKSVEPIVELKNISVFYNNVIINYDNKIITCDNLDLNMTENIAVGYDNVIVKDSNSIMKAQNITLNIITKDISINSKNKIEIISN